MTICIHNKYKKKILITFQHVSYYFPTAISNQSVKSTEKIPSELLRRKQWSWPEVFCAIVETQTTYQRPWQRNRGGSVRRTQWGTTGLRTSSARSPAAPGGCKGLCDNREAVATTDTSESVRRKNTHKNVLMFFLCSFSFDWATYMKRANVHSMTCCHWWKAASLCMSANLLIPPRLNDISEKCSKLFFFPSTLRDLRHIKRGAEALPCPTPGGRLLERKKLSTGIHYHKENRRM